MSILAVFGLRTPSRTRMKPKRWRCVPSMIQCTRINGWHIILSTRNAALHSQMQIYEYYSHNSTPLFGARNLSSSIGHHIERPFVQSGRKTTSVLRRSEYDAA